MAEICQRVLVGIGMPVEWTLSIVVPILMRLGDIRNCQGVLVIGVGVCQ